jgi:hypothetical protein
MSNAVKYNRPYRLRRLAKQNCRESVLSNLRHQGQRRSLRR